MPTEWRHHSELHPPAPAAAAAAATSLSCSVCTRTFESAQGLKVHLRWHKRISATSGEAESVNHLEAHEQADGGEGMNTSIRAQSGTSQGRGRERRWWCVGCWVQGARV